MLHREPRRFTPEEYLRLDSESGPKSEYVDGYIYAMSGGTLEHNRIVRNLLGMLDTALAGKTCEAFPSDLRLWLDRHSLFTYPDILVVCGEPWLYPGRTDTVTDATLLVEVLSPSTQDYDSGDKFRYYRSLPSFQEYLLVAQDACRIEQYRRQPSGDWLLREHLSPDGELDLSSIAVRIPVRPIYRGVPLP